MKIITFCILLKDAIVSFKGAKKSDFFSVEETINKIIYEKKSLIRIGDGEFGILKGKDVHYQKNSAKLIEDMKIILDEYVKNYKKSKYLLCMPKDYLSCSIYKILFKKKYFISWPSSRKEFCKKYDLDIVYGDSFCFAEGYEALYQKIWQRENIKNIIFVHNKKKFSKKLSDKKIYFIKIPPFNTYEQIDKIYNQIKNKYKMLNSNETLILISAGPAGKVLVYRLAKDNIFAIDTGHCFSGQLKKIE